MAQKIFYTKKAFSPALVGLPIYYKGLDRSGDMLDGYFLVRSVMDDEISVINGNEDYFYVSIESFNEDEAQDGTLPDFLQPAKLLVLGDKIEGSD